MNWSKELPTEIGYYVRTDFKDLWVLTEIFAIDNGSLRMSFGETASMPLEAYSKSNETYWYGPLPGKIGAKDIRTEQIGKYLISGKATPDAIKAISCEIENLESMGELEIFITEQIDEICSN